MEQWQVDGMRTELVRAEAEAKLASVAHSVEAAQQHMRNAHQHLYQAFKASGGWGWP
ncbi:hypothetical protein [Mycobacteroides abscessus]|uniref:hypothetical protein n=1 Tax=Mycobacteroides abscessus TaxID=36809 RepID=UPI001878C76D|nr:hypothetical protein [Mycobacteroides abscessus]